MDRPDTYTLLDFISYLCEFGFYKFFFDLRFCVLNDARKRSVSVAVRLPSLVQSMSIIDPQETNLHHSVMAIEFLMELLDYVASL